MGVVLADGTALANNRPNKRLLRANPRNPRQSRMTNPALIHNHVDVERFCFGSRVATVETAFTSSAIGATFCATAFVGSTFEGGFAMAGFNACESLTNVPCMGTRASSQASLKA